MQGGRTTLAAVLGIGLLLATSVPRAGAAVVVTPGPLQRYREAHVALAGGEYLRARAMLEELPPEFLLADYAAYFAADREDGDAVSLCFTEAAVVKDEGHTYRGRAAINRWKADASAKYQYTSEPLAGVRKDGTVVVTSRLTGNFPGSPVDLRFFFVLEGDKIASLEIMP